MCRVGEKTTTRVLLDGVQESVEMVSQACTCLIWSFKIQKNNLRPRPIVLFSCGFLNLASADVLYYSTHSPRQLHLSCWDNRNNSIIIYGREVSSWMERTSHKREREKYSPGPALCFNFPPAVAVQICWTKYLGVVHPCACCWVRWWEWQANPPRRLGKSQRVAESALQHF